MRASASEEPEKVTRMPSTDGSNSWKQSGFPVNMATTDGTPTFFAISAATTSGTAELMDAVCEKLAELPPVKVYEAQPVSQEDWIRKVSNRQEFEVEVEDGVYYVYAVWIEPILRTVNMEDYSSLQYFQRVLRSSGIIDRLEEMGIEEGDTVNILGFEFDFIR